MKNVLIPIVQIAMTTLFLLISNLAFSQIKTTWKGGTPGMEQNWNCHKNWSNYQVPDEFSDVLIPDVSSTSLFPPILFSGTTEINSIFLESGASLTISKGAQLMVYQTATGIFPPNIQVEGSLLLLEETTPTMAKASAVSESEEQ